MVDLPLKLVFEPHNGFGSTDPDGCPWPFGYVSIDRPRVPLFEISPVVGDVAHMKRVVDELILAYNERRTA